MTINISPLNQPTKMGYIFVDKNLTIMTNNDFVRQWAAETLFCDSLVGQQIDTVFPELVGYESDLKEIVNSQVGSFILTQLQHVNCKTMCNHYFNLQVQAFRFQNKETLMITVVDVTENSHTEQKVTQERNEFCLEIRKLKNLQENFHHNHEQLIKQLERREQAFCHLKMLLKQEFERSKNLESTLSRNIQLYKTLFENTTWAVVLIKPDGAILQANHIAIVQSQRNKSDLLGQCLWEHDWWLDSNTAQAQVQKGVREALQSKQSVQQTIKFDHHQQAKKIHYLINPIYDVHGEISVLLAFHYNNKKAA